MNKIIRTIKTGMYGQRAFDVLDALQGQMSDGLWENSPAYDKYWRNFDADREYDGEVVVKVNAAPFSSVYDGGKANPFHGMPDAEVLKFLARKLKAVVKAEAEDEGWADGWWSRGNKDKSQSVHYLDRDLDVTVADVYAVYDALLGRTRRADPETAGRVYGAKLDEETTARRRAKAEAKAALLAKFNADMKAHRDELAAFEADMKKQLEAKAGEIRAAEGKTRAEYLEKLSKLHDEFAA